MKNHLGVTLAIGAMLGLAGPASADVLIDNYSITKQQVTDPATVIGVPPNEIIVYDTQDEDELAVAGEGAGETRYIQVDSTNGGAVAIQVAMAGSGANSTSAVDARGNFLIGYDGTIVADPNAPFFDPGRTIPEFTPTAGTLDLDFTGLNSLAIDAVSDLGATLIFTLWNGSNEFSAQKLIPGTGGLGSLETYYIPFSSFIGSGDLVLGDIDAISISSPASVEAGRDVKFTNFKATNHVPAPEPASIMLLAVGGLGCVGGAWRQRRKQRTKGEV